MASEKLSRVKAAMEQLNNGIDDAEDKIQESNQNKREALDRLEKTLEDAESYRRRSKLIQIDLDKIRKTIEEKQTRLEHQECRCNDDDEKRREYEGIEIERDDELTVLEQECVTAKQQATEALCVLSESERKLQVVDGEVEKMCNRLEMATKHDEDCTGTIERIGIELRDLESRDDDAATREMEAEEKLRFLQEQLKEEVSRAENAERDVIRNEKIVENIVAELEKVRAAIKSLETEVESFDEFVGSIDAAMEATTDTAYEQEN